MLPGYRVIRRLSRPGAAPIWAAEDAAGRQVALKYLLPSERHRSDLLHRFETEGRLQHELGGRHHLLRCHSTGLDPEPVLVLEYASGGSLRDRIERGHVHLAEAVEIVAGVADALDWLHANGVFHRDVKPSNILIMADGSVRLADLGVAACGTPPRGLPEGWIEEEIGTLGYAAPELLRDPGLATVAIDVYGLGVTLCELLTGALPFALAPGETEPQLRQRLAQGPPPRIPTGVSPSIRAVLAKAIAPQATDRFPSGQAFAEALAKAAGVTQPSR